MRLFEGEWAKCGCQVCDTRQEKNRERCFRSMRLSDAFSSPLETWMFSAEAWWWGGSKKDLKWRKRV